MKAFVLSGGANYGAIQVGALQALLENGHHPDMLVGVSAGALNAAWLAGHPDIKGVEQLVRVWRDFAPKNFSPLSQLPALLNVVRGQGYLLSNLEVKRFVTKFLPPDALLHNFNAVHLYITAAQLSDGTLKVFGDDPQDTLLDALMSSTALPPLFPPWHVNGEEYVDGGLASNLPIQVAIDRGADEIIALQTCHPLLKDDRAFAKTGIVAYIAQTMGLLIRNQAKMEIRAARLNPAIRLHVIELWPEADPGFWIFNKAEALIAAGYRTTEAYLKNTDFRRPNLLQQWVNKLLQH